jgi:hypothetical protein
VVPKVDMRYVVTEVSHHPHNPYSHYSEVRYAHPAGHQEGDPQVYIPNDA